MANCFSLLSIACGLSRASDSGQPNIELGFTGCLTEASRSETRSRIPRRPLLLSVNRSDLPLHCEVALARSIETTAKHETRYGLR